MTHIPAAAASAARTTRSSVAAVAAATHTTTQQQQQQQQQTRGQQAMKAGKPYDSGVILPASELAAFADSWHQYDHAAEMRHFNTFAVSSGEKERLKHGQQLLNRMRLDWFSDVQYRMEHPEPPAPSDIKRQRQFERVEKVSMQLNAQSVVACTTWCDAGLICVCTYMCVCMVCV